jgi:hypothetical protein
MRSRASKKRTATMPHAKILTKQSLYTLGQLHSELAGKLSANLRETKRLRLAIFQGEAVR